MPNGNRLIGNNRVSLQDLYPKGADNYVLTMDGTTVGWEPAAGSGDSTVLTIEATAKTGNYTLTTSDQVILADSSGGAFTITTPAASSNSGRYFYIKKVDSSSNFVTLKGAGSETVDGATTFDLFVQWQAVMIVSDGSNWLVLSQG